MDRKRNPIKKHPELILYRPARGDAECPSGEEQSAN